MKIYTFDYGDDCECGLNTHSLHSSFAKAVKVAEKALPEMAWGKHVWKEETSDWALVVKFWRLGDTHDVASIRQWNVDFA